MRSLTLATGECLRILCLGAHADDIEIGCGGTILDLLARGIRLEVTWCVLSATPVRAEEARASAAAFLEGAADTRVDVQGFRDGHFPVAAGPSTRQPCRRSSCSRSSAIRNSSSTTSTSRPSGGGTPDAWPRGTRSPRETGPP
jgi:LmbE family N-acetylglucosaminyl deacetylase